MPHRTIELALVAAEPAPHRAAGRDRNGAGPGWFDSSWELQRGLEVTEGWSDADRVDAWIADFLRAQRTAFRTASPSASTAIA